MLSEHKMKNVLINEFNLLNKIMSKIISTCVLYLLGWKSLNLNNKYYQPYIVCVFSHSSYYDFFIMLLYKYKYYDVLHNLKVVIKPDFFKYFGYLLRRIDGIPATNIAHQNGGKTAFIVNEVQKSPTARLLICPKGTIIRGKWKTGYYHIAKALNAPLCVVGLDYERKNIYFGDTMEINEEEPIIQKKLYQELGNIVPLHPEQENMPIRPHNMDNVSVISTPRIIGYSFLSIGIIMGIYISLT